MHRIKSQMSTHQDHLEEGALVDLAELQIPPGNVLVALLLQLLLGEHGVVLQDNVTSDGVMTDESTPSHMMHNANLIIKIKPDDG
jgi:hypothetical protein